MKSEENAQVRIEFSRYHRIQSGTRVRTDYEYSTVSTFSSKCVVAGKSEHRHNGFTDLIHALQSTRLGQIEGHSTPTVTASKSKAEKKNKTNEVPKIPKDAADKRKEGGKKKIEKVPKIPKDAADRRKEGGKKKIEKPKYQRSTSSVRTALADPSPSPTSSPASSHPDKPGRAVPSPGQLCQL